MNKIVTKNDNCEAYKAHPITIFYNLKPVLFVLLFPLLKALINALLRREINGLFLNEAILLSAIMFYSVLKWRNFSLTLADASVVVRSGLFLRRIAEIPKSKISTIETVRTIPDRIFGSTTLKINTEAGRRGKADYAIRLSRDDAKSIADALSHTPAARTLKFSAVRVAIMSAAASSAFTGIIFTVPAIKTAGELLGTAIEQVLLDRINEVSVLNKLFPPIINIITIIFLLLYGVAFLVNFFRCVNFKVAVGNGKIEISNGLLTQRKISFKTKTVNSAIIEQAPLMRIFKRYLVRISIGGYGDNRGNKAVLVPSAKKREVHELFSVLFPDIHTPEKLIRPNLYTRRRFYLLPTMCLAAALIIYAVLFNLFPVFRNLINFGGIIAAVVLAYFYSLAEYNTRNSALAVSNILYGKYTRWGATREMFCEADRIGVIHIVKWPLDRKIGTCSIRLTERSENAESIKVKYINYEETRKQLSDFYGFE